MVTVRSAQIHDESSRDYAFEDLPEAIVDGFQFAGLEHDAGPARRFDLHADLSPARLRDGAIFDDEGLPNCLITAARIVLLLLSLHLTAEVTLLDGANL